MTADSESPRRLLENLAGKNVSLSLNSLDICFLAALRLRARDGNLTSFGEERLNEAFRDVCGLTLGGSEGVSRRATAAIQRLRDQRLLTRVDGAGVIRTGEYALTRLATSIVDFFLEDDALTGESLTLLTRTLHVSLAEVREQARAALSADDFRERVAGPLRVTIRDLVDGIERRQRGLDLQQEQFQREIGALLESDWFDAVARCQGLLDGTSATLRELNEVLLRDSHALVSILEDIRELSAARGATEAEEVCHRLSEQLDRIAAWGAARQNAWSEYYQYVHRYLRDVVRLDPTRALTQRLRAQLSGRAGRSFSLVVASSPAMVVPREVAAPVERPPVKRPRAERERPLAEPVLDDREARLEAAVGGALDEGARSLSEVTERVVRELPEAERFATAGRVAELASRLSTPESQRERPWIAVEEGMLIEEWTLRRPEGKP